ncbi:MAG: hypothetical protein IPJ81_15095 [Chitinophagaceae bacterium]|nr:hypothetical protein [Chitinophagaceae bacterium]
MANQYDDTLFKTVSPDFKLHLEENSRIVFSAKFGKGKTTFLREIFQNQEKYFEQEKYEIIHLFPVNYAVAANEDIFRYIKYDIIIAFLKRGLDIENLDFSFMQKLEWFTYQKPLKILANILSFIPKVGMTFAAIKDSFEKIKLEFEKWARETAQKVEGDAFVQYIEEIEKTEGLIYENDFITKFIEKCIEKLKGTEEDKKEIVLIIDDLDRIDPEHIFRILNVFAAHFDNTNYNNYGKENKFGFDKIIVVCDYNNLKSIFYHKYGIDTDFIGYISKFYNKSFFDYTNSINNLLTLIFQSLNFRLPNNNYYSLAKHSISIDLDDLVYGLYKYNFISLREILNLKNKVFSKFNDGINYKEVSFFNDEIFLPTQMIILKLLCGDYISLLKGLSVLKEKKFAGRFINFVSEVNKILYVNTISVHKHEYSSYGNLFQFNYNHLKLGVTIDPNFRNNKEIIIKDYNNNAMPYKNNLEDYYTLLMHLCQQLHSESIL